MSRKRAGRKIKGDLDAFLILRDLCDNEPTLYTIFDEFSQGIFTRFRSAVKFNDDKLLFKIRGKGKPIEVPISSELDPEEMLEQCKIYFRKLGVKTQNELQAEREKEDARNEQGFASVKSQKDRQHYLERYIEHRSIIDGLTEEECIDLQHEIFMGLMTGAIDNSDIKFVNNRIEEIIFDSD